MARKKRRKVAVPPDFQLKNRARMMHNHRKTILFSEKELSIIEQYCKKFSIKNKSAFFRNVILSHIMEQIDENYPKLF